MTVPNVTSLRSEPPEPEPEPESDLLRRWTMAELESLDDRFEWLVKGLWAHPSYGQIAGPLKTLKSTIHTMALVGIAGGVDILGQFRPVAQRPVLLYYGEGGERLFKRRLRRICRALGVRITDLDLHVVFQSAPILSDVFQETLARDLREIEPAMAGMDPLYVYHGATVKASNLHEEGALLSAISRPCMEVGASLSIVNHFNQTGSGMDLSRITMAGSGEHSDSWVLLAHRDVPNVAKGSFKLRMDVGSRQWGGSSWDIDLELGYFDEELGDHIGDITWDLRRVTGLRQTTDKAADTTDADMARILAAAERSPWMLTREELAKTAGGNLKRIRDLVDEMSRPGGPLKTMLCTREGTDGKRRRAATYGPAGREQTETDAA